ncbi:hypothetical protein BDR07DRAFT_1429214 [Suillus spraguei]|nr:hypothetical protein BDR07DRAFT_1429214 [Suillus spraguei]
MFAPPGFQNYITLGFINTNGNSHCQRSCRLHSNTELSKALSEQAFGLARFDVYGGSSPHEATASVTLLEGRTILITLTARGYQLDENQIFESIEGLLQAVSTAYEGKRREALFSRLRSLS